MKKYLGLNVTTWNGLVKPVTLSAFRLFRRDIMNTYKSLGLAPNPRDLESIQVTSFSFQSFTMEEITKEHCNLTV